MANGITDLAAFKLHLDISTSTEDPRLTAFLDQAVSHIQGVTKQKLEDLTHTEYYEGDGTDVLILRQLPVVSITSVHVDSGGRWNQGSGSPFPAADLLTAGDDYALRLDSSLTNTGAVSRSGLLYRVNATWAQRIGHSAGRLTGQGVPSLGNVKVVYRSGYPSADVPLDLKLLCHQVAAVIRREAVEGASLASEGIEGYSYSVAGPVAEMLALGSSRAILGRYREWF